MRRKKDAYEETRQRPDWWHDWVAANLWTAAFFVPANKFDDPAIPTFSKFASYLRGGHVDGQLEGVAIDSIEDVQALFKGIKLEDVTTSMTINATAFILLSLHVAVAKQHLHQDLKSHIACCIADLLL